MPPAPPPNSLDDRVAELERLLSLVLTRARAHPVGRKILAYLGLLP